MTTGGGRLRPSFLINFDSMALSRFIDECRLDLDLGAIWPSNDDSRFPAVPHPLASLPEELLRRQKSN
jgi:hypothetical protein